jgi:hypothetical protein
MPDALLHSELSNQFTIEFLAIKFDQVRWYLRGRKVAKQQEEICTGTREMAGLESEEGYYVF